MTESTAGPEDAPLDGPRTDAADLRDGGSTAVGATTAPGAAIPGLPALPDSPDARTDGDIDDVREGDGGIGGDDVTEDSYGLRSGIHNPGTENDPASYLNP